MGNLTSNILEEQQLGEFKKISSNADVDVELPAPPESRTLTDKKGFVIFGILMLVLFPFLIYTLVKSDIRRLGHGVDSCGNLCGVTNAKISGINCSGQDYSNQPYEKILISENKQICTSECPFTHVQKGKKCIDEDDIFGNNTIYTAEVWQYTLNSWWKFIIDIVITIVLSIGMLVLFRYIPGVIVWGVSVFSLIVAVAVTSFFWFNFKQDNNQGWLSLALISTVFTIIIFILFVVMFKRIQLIIQLYKETTKAIFAMPAIIFLPLITLIIQVLVLTLMIVTSVWMATARELKKDQQNTYQYHQNGAMQFAMAFNIIVTIWALQFFAGCQYMTLAGSVAQWFFKKNQANSPIVVSFTNTMRFHLGTIALGSFIITLMALIRAVIRSLINNNKLKWLCDCCCGNLEALLKFLSKNSYIETAIHGQSFFRSGKRAAKQLITNAGSVIALNSVGDFVMVMTQFILVAISTAIAYALFLDSPNNLLLPTVISFILNLIIVVIIFGVFGTTVDTLFICFCEDKSINDGTTKPYYMSKGLMQFVENSKKFYKEN
ncbi:unnamed protein product [Tenebrio molitor]|nr:unnamed protein product [Tenebrio molitor]